MRSGRAQGIPPCILLLIKLPMVIVMRIADDDSDANNQGAVNNGDVGDDEGGVDDQDDMDDQGVGSSP